MNITLKGIGKRYRHEWVFRKLDFEFREGRNHAILGPNGSGKSTLMKLLSGHLSPSVGRVEYTADGVAVPIENVYEKVSYAAPYIELIEELTLEEVLAFHRKFKPLPLGMEAAEIQDILALPKSAASREISFFSSGMKQRVKLALALISRSSLILLDEPTTNLDRQGMDWYLQLVEQFGVNRNIIVASNEERDYAFCDQFLSITDYKPRKRN